MTLLRLALRSHLSGFAATSVVGLLFGLLNALAYADLAGSDPAQRAIFARQMEIVGRQLSYILPLPLELETLSGYMQWRVFGTIALIYAFWALIAASGAGRGDEERGLLETWLAAGVTRLRYLAVRMLAFLVAAGASIAAMLAFTWIGSVVAREALSIGALLLQGVDLLALGAFCFAWTLLVAQVTTTRRGAGGIAGIVLLVLFLIDSATRTGGLEQIRWISPFWLYDRSTPLLRAGAFDVAAVAALAAATIVDLVLATAAFAARDVGASLLRTVEHGARRVTRPAPDPLLRVPVLRVVDRQRAWVVGWGIGLAGLAGSLVSLTRTMVDALLAIPSMRVYFERLGPTGYDSFIAVIWGSTATLLLSLFAIFEVSGWVADDAEGRLEAVLAQPIGRGAVALERLGSLLAGAALVALAGSAAVWLAASSAAIPLSRDRFAVGSVLMLAVPLAFGSIGAAIASWRPRVAVPLLTAVAIASYLTQQFAPLFDWPEWVEKTSIYALYGFPISRGVDWGGILGLLAICATGTALAVALFQRRDVGR